MTCHLRTNALLTFTMDARRLQMNPSHQDGFVIRINIRTKEMSTYVPVL